MMKKNFPAGGFAHRMLCLTIAILSLFLSLSAQSPNPNKTGIHGPLVVCTGQTYSYTFLIPPGTAALDSVVWEINGGGVGSTVGANPFILDNVPASLGPTFVLSATAFYGGFLDPFIDDVTISVNTAPVLDIASTALELCPSNQPDPSNPLGPIADCEQVCANSVVTYSVNTSNEVVWNIEGAESFTVQGASVVVQWGAPGQGLLEVMEVVPADTVQLIDCGALGFNFNSSGSVPGAILYFIIEGMPGVEYPIFITSPDTNFLPIDTIGEDGFNQIIVPASTPDFSLIYEIGLIDPVTGDTLICLIDDFINPQCTPPVFQPNISESSCDSCTGSISLNIQPSVPSQVFTYIWSNGISSSSLQNLCPGFYSVTVFDNFDCAYDFTYFVGDDCPDPCPGFGSLCVDIIPNPEARFLTTPAASGDTLEICQGQTVFFDNLTTGAETYEWQLGDGTASSLPEPAHTYNQPGLYRVDLIARNACQCADSALLFVRVTDAISPEITCNGTLCEGGVATYSTDIDCGTFTWAISPEGMVVDGGGPLDNFVTVEWGDGPVGTVSLSVADCNVPGTLCLNPTVEQVGVITDDNLIQGPMTVCKGARESYAVFPFTATSFTWSTSGFGQIVEGQGTSQAVVQWTDQLLPAAPQWVAVTYDNCYLGCQGTDTIWVNMRQEFTVSGPLEGCENGSGLFEAFAENGDPVFCDWEVQAPDGSLSQAFNNQSSIAPDWTAGSGRYQVTATPVVPTDYCNPGYRLFPSIQAIPATPAGIQGPLEVCPGQSYVYEPSLINPGVSYEWTIINGGNTEVLQGNQVIVNWGSTPPRELQLRAISQGQLPCLSQALSFSPQPVNTLDITGPTEDCLYATSSFSSTVYSGADYQWTLLPASAGTVVSGQGGSQIEVLWHETGSVTLEVSYCGLTATLPFEVLPLPKPDPQYPTPICSGQTPTITTATPFAAYQWSDENGDLLSDSTTLTTGTGIYVLQVEDVAGCTADTVFTIAESPLPDARIEVPLYLALCPGGTATLHALGTESGYSYQWFWNGNPTGNNAATLTTADPGTYTLEVTDVNGCTNTSTATLLDCAALGGTCVNGICTGLGGGPPAPPVPGCNPQGNLSFDINPTIDCQTKQYTNTSINFIPGSLVWDFDDPASGPNNTSTDENPTHLFEGGVGFYTVVLFGQVPGANGDTCNLGVYREDTIVYAPDFSYSRACPGQEMQFTDQSTFLPIGDIVAWDWDFGDPASGAANFSTDQDPTHSYANPGSYNVALTITGMDGCQSTVTQIVEVLAPPQLAIDLPTAQCEDQSLGFAAVTDPGVSGLQWDFGDPGSGAANFSVGTVAQHVFANAGNYTITLSGQGSNGCRSTQSETIAVVGNPLIGSISALPSPPLCPEDSTLLSAPPGGNLWAWSTGDTTATVFVTATDIYQVTVTNTDGCTYRPPAVQVSQFDPPYDLIRAVQFNDNGLPGQYFYNNLNICEGDPLYLEMLGLGDFSYSWSSGQSDSTVIYSEERGNPLPVGSYLFSVTITDNSTGCTSTAGPFSVEVNPLPADVDVAAAPFPACEGTPVQISITNPQPGLTYLWSNGAQNTHSISVNTAGDYFVQVVNSFGCRARSDTVPIDAGPNPGIVPDGCRGACPADTLCLPTLPNVVQYQWFLDGSPVPPPQGTAQNPVFTQSGVYTLVLTGTNGCTSTAPGFNLDVVPGIGDISGQVYEDVNDNGLIDGPDTLNPGILLILLENGVTLDSVTTDSLGQYAFEGLPLGGYTVLIPDASGYDTLIGSWNRQIDGCFEEEIGDGLIDFRCPPVFDTLEVAFCANLTFDTLGVSITAGDTVTVNTSIADGCDSFLTIIVLPLQLDTTFLNLQACDGDSVFTQGQWLLAGTDTSFLYSNQNGCDSLVEVVVQVLPVPASDLTLSVCPGGTLSYGGQSWMAGDTGFVVLAGQNGCDSIVNVRVDSLPIPIEMLTVEVCPGDSVQYAGVWLQEGADTVFLLSSPVGCDSLVSLLVQTAPDIAAIVEPLDPSCWNRATGSISVDIQGMPMPPVSLLVDGVTVTSTGNVIEGLSAGRYQVEVIDGNGCSEQLEVLIEEIEPIQIGQLRYLLDCESPGVRLEPLVLTGGEGAIEYLWPDGSSNADFLATSPGLIPVTVSNECEELELIVEVVPGWDSLDRVLALPNVFSPNGDGVNDLFQPVILGDFQVLDYRLQIFSRWGDLLFETRDFSQSWDGRMKGEYLNPGVYIWQVWVDVADCRGQLQTIYDNGDVTITR